MNDAELGEAQNTNDRFGGKFDYKNALPLIVTLNGDSQAASLAAR